MDGGAPDLAALQSEDEEEEDLAPPEPRRSRRIADRSQTPELRRPLPDTAPATARQRASRASGAEPSDREVALASAAYEAPSLRPRKSRKQVPSKALDKKEEVEEAVQVTRGGGRHTSSASVFQGLNNSLVQGSASYFEAWERRIREYYRVRAPDTDCMYRHRSKMRIREVVLKRESRLNAQLQRREAAIRARLLAEVSRLREELRRESRAHDEELLATEEVRGLLEKGKEDRRTQQKAYQAKKAQLLACLEALNRSVAEEEEDPFVEVEPPLPLEQPAPSKGRQAASEGEKRRPATRAKAPIAPSLKRGGQSTRATKALSGGVTPVLEMPEAVPGVISPPVNVAGEVTPELTPFVEYVGAPVGKGMKVPSGLWGMTTTDVMTRGRTRQQ